MKIEAEQQPKDGDTIVHCGHIDVSPHHFWKPTGTMKFQRPDHTFGDAAWIVCCAVCFQAAGGDPKQVAIRGDGTWLGDKPAVYKETV